jgi:hypothetical protein
MINWQHWFGKEQEQNGIVSFNKKRHKKNGLIIYAPWAVAAFRDRTYREKDFVSHSMHWESIEIVKALTELGYNIDYADCTAPLPKITWAKYNLVIDERGNLYDNISKIDAIKIFYATGCHWSFHNDAEELRINEFNDRFGLNLTTQRKVDPILSGTVADITTYFGNDFQKQLFPDPQKAISLNLSTVFLPLPKLVRPVEERRKNFIWLGSRGFIHKGLDIVVEAFINQPDLNLHICTDLTLEPEFHNWFKNIIAKSKNIFYHGFLDVTSTEFFSVIAKCIAIPYVSCAEGGAGAVLQAMQFNCFPIVNKSTALRGEEFGIVLKGNTRRELLEQLIESLDEIRNLPIKYLKEMTEASGEYARKNHSRKAYSDSFKELLKIAHAQY